jgi:FkbM family methyltransferase
MPGIEHRQALRCMNVGSVIDVGANKGQFSLIARSLFPDVEIHAFEPIESELEIFKSVVSGPVKHYPVALGARTTQAQFYLTSRLDSSSLLKPGRDHREMYGVEIAASRTVPVVRLAEVIDVHRLVPPVLMKLDVQGGELDVLNGAADILPFIDAIYTEASFVSLYENQPLAGEIIAFLVNRGFGLRGVYNHSIAPGVGPTQADFLFVKADPDAAARQPRAAPPATTTQSDIEAALRTSSP